MRSSMFQRRFVIVSGKGGVGRSTLAAALGLAAARYGMRTCVAQLNSRDELGRIFHVDASGYQPVRLAPDLVPPAGHEPARYPVVPQAA